MPEVDLESSVPDWLIEYPQALAVLESFGIDYSCGGKSLETACGERGLDPREIVRLVKQARRD